MTTHAAEKLERYRSPQNRRASEFYRRAEHVLPPGRLEQLPHLRALSHLHPAGPGLADVGRGRARVHRLLALLRRHDGRPLASRHGRGHRQGARARARSTACRTTARSAAPELICERFAWSRCASPTRAPRPRCTRLRMARAYTGRDKVLKFEGAYHGGHDTVLVSVKPPEPKVGHVSAPEAAGRGPAASRRSRSRTRWSRTWNDAEGRAGARWRRHENEVAAIIVEPVMMNVGVMAAARRVPAGAARAVRRVRLPAGVRRGEDRGQAGLGRRAGALQGEGGRGVPGQGRGRRPAPGRVRVARREVMDEIAQLPLVPRRHLREQPAGHDRLRHGASRRS